MTVFNLSVTHGLRFADAVEGVVEDLDFVGAMGNDLAFCVGRVQGTIRRRTMVNDPAAGAIRKTVTDMMTVQALQTVTNERDVEQQLGKIRLSDTKYRVEAEDCKFVPRAGDTFNESEIVAVDVVTLNTCYILWCRE